MEGGIQLAIRERKKNAPVFPWTFCHFVIICVSKIFLMSSNKQDVCTMSMMQEELFTIELSKCFQKYLVQIFAEKVQFIKNKTKTF